MNNKELQEILKQHPDDAELLFFIDGETDTLRLHECFADTHPERNELTLEITWRQVFEND